MTKATCGCGKRYKRLGKNYDKHVRACKGDPAAGETTPPKAPGRRSSAAALPADDYSDQIPRSMKGSPLGSALYDLIAKREEKKRELSKLDNAISTIKALGQNEVTANPTALG